MVNWSHNRSTCYTRGINLINKATCQRWYLRNWRIFRLFTTGILYSQGCFPTWTKPLPYGLLKWKLLQRIDSHVTFRRLIIAEKKQWVLFLRLCWRIRSIGILSSWEECLQNSYVLFVIRTFVLKHDQLYCDNISWKKFSFRCSCITYCLWYDAIVRNNSHSWGNGRKAEMIIIIQQIGRWKSSPRIDLVFGKALEMRSIWMKALFMN